MVEVVAMSPGRATVAAVVLVVLSGVAMIRR